MLSRARGSPPPHGPCRYFSYPPHPPPTPARAQPLPKVTSPQGETKKQRPTGRRAIWSCGPPERRGGAWEGAAEGVRAAGGGGLGSVKARLQAAQQVSGQERWVRESESRGGEELHSRVAAGKVSGEVRNVGEREEGRRK